MCIRPLRLFLSAESIRRVRILLLRATHLPFVALIRAYEYTRRQIMAQQHFPTPINTATSPMSITRDRRPKPKPTRSYDHDPLTVGSGPGRARTKAVAAAEGPSEARGAGPEQAGRGDMVELADVIDEVDRLRIQVDRVVALMAVRRH